MTRTTSTQGGNIGGIHANNVYGQAIAVGDNAQANVHNAPVDAAALARAIGDLREGIARLPLQPAARDLVERDVKALAETAQTVHPDEHKAETHLQGIADKLKMVGVILAEAVGLAEPVTQIANLLRVPLKFLTN